MPDSIRPPAPLRPGTADADACDTARPSLAHRILLYARLLVRRLRGGELEVEAPYLADAGPVRVGVSTPRELSRATALHEEGPLLRVMVDALRPGDVVYDVGANVGLMSLALAVHPRGRSLRAFGFEPEPVNLGRFRRNIVLNGLEERVRAHGIALGDRDGSVTLHVRGGAGEGRHSTLAAHRATTAVEVPVRTAASFAEESGATPNVAKIDVEGAEGSVLAGMEPLLRDGNPRDVFLEIHPKGGGDRMPDGTPLHDRLAAHGYERVWTAPTGSRQYRHYTRRGRP